MRFRCRVGRSPVGGGDRLILFTGRLMKTRSLVPGVLLSLAFAGLAEGQDTPDTREIGRGVVIAGQVLDQITSNALPTARITLRGAGADGVVAWAGITGNSGEFRTGRVAMGLYEFQIQALGFISVSHFVTFAEDGAVDLRIEMVPVAYELEPIVVTAIRQSRLETKGFFERRRTGLGHSLTRAEIEARGASRVSELFYSIPGTRVLPSRPGRSGDVRLRGGCVPQMVIDGFPISFPIPVDELLSMGELEALEVYHGSSGPVQSLGYSCGTVMAWTREAGSAEGDPFSWRRMFTAVGLLTFLVLISPR